MSRQSMREVGLLTGGWSPAMEQECLDSLEVNEMHNDVNHGQTYTVPWRGLCIYHF